MSDLISRKAAIDALLQNQEVYSNNSFGTNAINKYTNAIDKFTIAIIDNDVQTIAQLPSAQPERGRWIKMNGDRGYECSRCGWESDTTWDFCPNCGALNIERSKNDSSEDTNGKNAKELLRMPFCGYGVQEVFQARVQGGEFRVRCYGQNHYKHKAEQILPVSKDG